MDNTGLVIVGIIGVVILTLAFATWMVMLGYPLVVDIVFADGQELVNQTISFGDAFVFMIGAWLLAGGPLAFFKAKG